MGTPRRSAISPLALELLIMHINRDTRRDSRMNRILLAEDDDAMREYLARALTNAGYHVTDVDRGSAAAPLLESGTFDLLLTDIVMPEMDGIELAQHAASVAPEHAHHVHHRLCRRIIEGRRGNAARKALVEAVPPQGFGRRSERIVRPTKRQPDELNPSIRQCLKN